MVSVIVHAYIIYYILGLEDSETVSKSSVSTSIEAFCLLLPGKNLVLSDLLLGKKFRNRGGKVGALKAFRNLENDGFGALKLVPESRVRQSLNFL